MSRRHRVIARRIRVVRYRYRRLRRRRPWTLRALYAASALIVAISIALPIISKLTTDRAYELSTAARTLVGSADAKLTKQLTWDEEQQAWQFNTQDTASLPGGAGAAAAIAAMRTQVGAASGKKGDTSTFALTLPQDLSKGITYTDINTGLKFALVPEFQSRAGRMVDGHIVYPLHGGLQAIYTPKGNGLKEDIYVPQSHASDVNLTYHMQLPDTLGAQTLPDGSGGMGIYSADPTLFTATASTDQDTASLQKARTNSDKTNLVFALPSPTITTLPGKQSGAVSTRFSWEANHNQLSVISGGLQGLHDPISIDPSVVVTSASDFQTNGNNESMITFDTTNNQITRGSLTGGDIGSWTTASNQLGIYGASWVSQTVYAGYIYWIGIYDDTASTARNSCLYAALNSNGSLGSLLTCTTLSSIRDANGLVPYDGYMYVLGGNNAGTELNTVEYAKIQSDGSLGSWITTTNLPSATGFAGHFAYNGYMYMVGGVSSSNVAQTATYYAAIHADGTLGTWTSTTALPGGRLAAGIVQNNGYVYALGGTSSYNLDGTFYSTAYYAPIKADGTLGSWAATAALPTPLATGGVTAYGGYMYLFGGSTTSNVAQSALYYAQINANGTIGNWTATTSLSYTHMTFPLTGYNGYLYMAGGTVNGSGGSGDVSYAKIAAAGQPSAFTAAAGTFTTARDSGCVVVDNNGFLHYLGGTTTHGDSNYSTGLGDYTPITANGSLGTWNEETDYTDYGLVNFGCAATADGIITRLGDDYQWAPAAVRNNLYSSSNGALTTQDIGGADDLPSDSRTRVGAFSMGGYGGIVYVVGGGSGNAAWHAPVSSGYPPGIHGWVADPTMVNTYAYRSYAQVGNYIYALGGMNGSTAQSAVEYTTIKSNGSLDTWQSTTALPAAIGHGGATAVNGCIYVVGGQNTAGTPQSTVYWACPGASGAIASGSWHTASLATAVTDNSVTSYRGRIYSVGGYNGTSVLNTVQVALVNNGGTGDVGSWSPTTSLSNGAEVSASAAYNGYIYRLGAGPNVEHASINSNGTLGAWSAVSSLSINRTYEAVVAYNHHLYLVGGSDASSNGADPVTDSVQVATINDDGSLGTWSSVTPLLTSRLLASAAAYKGYLYAFGGYNGSSYLNSVEYAPIHADGTLGTWATTASFTTARRTFSASIYNGYAYIFGGWTGSTPLNNVQYAKVNSDGTLGSWAATSSFFGARTGAIVAMYNGYVYIAGGTTDYTTSYYNDVQYAPVGANGMIGVWQPATGLDHSVWGAGGVAYGGYLYSVGGYDSGGYATVVQYTPLNLIARTARYSKLIDFGTSVNVSSISWNGQGGNSVTPGVSPVTVKAAGSNGVFGGAVNASNVAGTGGCTGTTINTRYVLVSVILDDSGGDGTSAGGGFQDGVGMPANATDLTVNYNPVHPTPDIRLRGGQTLQNGNLSSLDTCQP